MFFNKSILLAFVLFCFVYSTIGNYILSQETNKTPNEKTSIKKNNKNTNSKIKKEAGLKKKSKKKKRKQKEKKEQGYQEERKGISLSSFTPYIGFWFGVVTPFIGTRLTSYINGFLGGGLYFRLYLPIPSLQLEAGISYTHYRSRNTTTLHLLPFYFALAYTIPSRVVVKNNLKLGVSGAFGYLIPEKRYNTLPGLIFGYELYFPAGKFIKIGLRIDYILIFDRHISAPRNRSSYDRVDGHFLHFGVTVHLTWVRKK